MKRRLLPFLQCQLIILLLAAAASGQIRLHDAANDELAKKTRDAFAEFSSGDANVFETMVSNTLSLREATLAHLYELNRQGTRDTANLIPVMTWKQLRETQVKRTQDQFLDAYNASRLILDPLAQNVPSLKVALAEAKAQLEVATTKRKEKADELTATQPKIKNLADSLDKLKDAMAASSRPINRLSDLTTEFSNLKAVWTNTGEVKAWWEAAEKSSNAPGLQLTILDLAVTHQRSEVERVKLDLEQAEAAKNRALRLRQRLELVWGTGELDSDNRATEGLFGQVYAGIGTVANENEQVLETIGKLATEAEEEVGKPLKATMQLRDLLDNLGRYVSLAGYQKYLLLSDVIDAGVDQHLFSIRRSAINTREREVLVSHGLDGLVAYHAGGLKPEQIANFFRAAQSIALGVLAGRGR